jgi:hypothetical protein
LFGDVDGGAVGAESVVFEVVEHVEHGVEGDGVAAVAAGQFEG